MRVRTMIEGRFTKGKPATVKTVDLTAKTYEDSIIDYKTSSVEGVYLDGENIFFETNSGSIYASPKLVQEAESYIKGHLLVENAAEKDIQNIHIGDRTVLILRNGTSKFTSHVKEAEMFLKDDNNFGLRVETEGGLYSDDKELLSKYFWESLKEKFQSTEKDAKYIYPDENRLMDHLNEKFGIEKSDFEITRE